MRGLGTVFDMKFAQDIGDVVFYGAFGKSELLGDFAVAGTLGEQLENLDLARAQFFILSRACWPGGFAFTSKFDEEFVGDFGLDGWLTGMDLANSCHQF